MYLRQFNLHLLYQISLCIVIFYSSSCRAFWLDRDTQYRGSSAHEGVNSRKTCPTSEFTCLSLDCVSEAKVCDGVRDCKDGSDENSESCPKLLDRPRSRVKRATTTNLCDVPSDPKMSIVVTDDSTERVVNVQRGSKAPISSRIEVTCNDGYTLVDAGKKQEAFCHPNKGWFPSLSPCLKTCPTLKPENVDLTCYYKDRQIACNATQLVSGTRVDAACKPFYSEAKQINYRSLQCREDGKWDNNLYKCVPACGRINELDTLIYGGKQTSVVDAPWNVAIYRTSTNHTLICGGTLISPRLVVSAAHCFYDQQKSEPRSATDYEVVVSKYTRDYKKTDSGQKKYKISVLAVHETFDPKNAGHYGFDIALLRLEEAVELSRLALPACVDWKASLGYNPGSGTLGKIVGWGIIDETNEGKPSETLLAANLPFISYQQCKGEFKIALPNDQFCAGSKSGPGLRKGDSGAGLVFQDKSQDDRYFLRGLVSSGRRRSSTNSNNIAPLTDISYHLLWLDSKRKALEKGLA